MKPHLDLVITPKSCSALSLLLCLLNCSAERSLLCLLQRNSGLLNVLLFLSSVGPRGSALGGLFCFWGQNKQSGFSFLSSSK